ncbi:outer membrane protein Iml2/Tetratricopeptide repeat protein 39 [Desarmillaria tabescens]|uniref:Outer membrane protein Iml2/Tetratricopeptide repeat protein 39 n=1 Tax=Armillaria tabescens TaxID=1929756 RepID=A0AA39MP91_ARMTA|nr:outer membrane protein Iml2/Tetratricopeptide repeat protein 39 [Desarmillaria tabescens]KAK0442051.1 outer membrane protein Iml2/Tetratricopeptide repeat protein 39 [Desarmillaria tabescens]
MSSPDRTTEQLRSASKGFDFLFSNAIADAQTEFTNDDSPFHSLGAGVCVFLEAAMGMESAKMEEAAKSLAQSEAGSRKQMKAVKSRTNARLPPGIEWEIVNVDSVVLLGITHALGESYMGYLQCIYSLNSAHSKFTKLFKTVFPNGLDGYRTPAASPSVSRKPSNPSIRSVSTNATKTSFFSKWSGGSTLAVPQPIIPEGPVEELIISGTAFGFGLFNLVFSLLPKRIQGVVGFFGFKHDRKLALQALAVSAAKTDVHSVFAALVLMTYHGVVLLLSGYQADEAHILKQYGAMVASVSERYPAGSLWILNQAKIKRMSYDAPGAIAVLRDGLKPDREASFKQADTLLVFELAWTLLAERRYEEAAIEFIRLTELNNWSPATYYFIATGCYITIGDLDKAQELFDAIPGMIDKRKMGGKDLPMEVLIKKKIEFYKEKQKRRGGDEKKLVQCMKISPAEEMAIFWNTHERISKSVAKAHIRDWASLTPRSSLRSAFMETLDLPLPPAGVPLDLDTPDELALRSLLLGIVHRVTEDFQSSRAFFQDAIGKHGDIRVSTWISGLAMFELAVVDLKEKEAGGKEGDGWEEVLEGAEAKLDKAMALAPNSTDLSSRLDSRISMLREEIGIKREMLAAKIEQ